MSKNVSQSMCDLNLDYEEILIVSVDEDKQMYYDKWIINVNDLYVVHSKLIWDLCMMKEQI